MVDPDIGRSVREVSKPLLEELAHSDIVDTVRSLDGRPGRVDGGMDSAEQDKTGRDPGTRERNWDGSGQRQAAENAVTSNTPRDPDRDKARAAMLFGRLVDEIKPWAAGAAVLYVLGYIAKLSVASRRRKLQRRMERRKLRSSQSRNGRL